MASSSQNLQEEIQWATIVTKSHLAPSFQYTLPAWVARKLKLARKNAPTFLETWYSFFKIKFKRGKNRNGGWRANRQKWKYFLEHNPVQIGDELKFQIVHRGPNVFYLKVQSHQMWALDGHRYDDDVLVEIEAFEDGGVYSPVTVKIED